MDKLYHAFCVFSYKGGELSSNLNLTIEGIAAIAAENIDWDELFDRCADDEKFSNMSDEEFFSLSCVQLLDKIDDQTLEDIAFRNLYPGNTYAFDSYSDYEIYSMNEKGKLKEVNTIKEPGFMEAFKKILREDAEWNDKHRKKNEN